MTTTYDLEAILGALSAGAPHKDIAAQHGVSKQLVSKIARNNGHRRYRPRTKKPAVDRGAGGHDLCYAHIVPTALDALPEGEWVLDPQRRVRIWKAAA